jgi:16S rRNA processing protein RimM
VIEQEFLEIGKIVAPQGLQGELRVYPDSDFPERFEQPGERWLLRPGATTPESIQLVAGRYLHGKGLYVVQLAGVTNREQSEALRGSKLLVPANDLPALEAGEFHVRDLIGLAVYDQSTQSLVGTVTDLFPAGNDLLEVERTDGSKVLIPFVLAIVPIVDLHQQRIEITPPPGLL